MSKADAPESRGAASQPETLTRWHIEVERLNVATSEAADAAFARGETAGAREFLWEPLAALVGEATRARRLSRAVLVGYFRVVRAAKIWESEMHWRSSHLEPFERGRTTGVVQHEWRGVLDRMLAADAQGTALPGGRGGTWRLATENGGVIVRRFRRGGAMRWLGDCYLGIRPRPLKEFAVLVRARRRGLPVPEPLAALVERRFGIAYRGALAMREIDGAMTLLEHLAAHPEDDLVALLAAELRGLHEAGLRHPDLNLGNVLVVSRPYGPRLVFVDLDRARLEAGPLALAARRRSLARLRRSAAKMDPAGRLLPAAAFDRLEALYWQAPGRGGAEDVRGSSR